MGPGDEEGRVSTERIKVVDEWRRVLQKGGYEHHCRTWREFQNLKRLSRMWRAILAHIRVPGDASVLEVGCGGGINLVRLALQGFHVSGIDVSLEVLHRARAFIDEVAHFDRRVRDIQLIEGDFLGPLSLPIPASSRGKGFDLVFSAGVAEHFLEAEERMRFLKRKFELTRPDGVVITIVPSGVHPYRKEQRQLGWGGYNVPEIDYSPQQLCEELTRAGAARVVVLPHNPMGYILARKGGSVAHLMHRMAWLTFPVMPKNVRNRLAYSFIAIGWKPVINL